MSQLNLFKDAEEKDIEAEDIQSKDIQSKDINVEAGPARETTRAAALPEALPEYRVRESNRAKHVSIKISVEGEVEVVVPPRFERAKLPEILARRQDWIAKTRSRLMRDRAQTPEDWQVEKPETIVFRWRSHALDSFGQTPQPQIPQPQTPQAQTSRTGVNPSKSIGKRSTGKGFATDSPNKTLTKTGTIETWSVDYQPTGGNKTRCIPQPDNHLLLQGNTDHLPACQAVLRKWLAHRAQRELAPWLRQLGFTIGLPCNNISVRGQKTRWASCSSHKDISLNFKLLFLPRPLVHYVLVHELCHTVHMNHSQRFWALVGEKQPDYQWRRDALKNAWRYVPRWVELK